MRKTRSESAPAARRRSARLHSLCYSHSADSPVEAGASAVLCKNFLLQTLIYFPRRHELRYEQDRQRIGTGGSPAQSLFLIQENAPASNLSGVVLNHAIIMDNAALTLNVTLGNTAQRPSNGLAPHLLRPKEVPLGYTFSVILHRNSSTYVSMPSKFLCNLTKKLTAHLRHYLCAVLPLLA